MAAALIAVAGLGYNIYTAEQQKAKAREIRRNTVRPGYEIPQSTKDIVAKTRFKAGTYGLPGQDRIEATLDQSASANRRSIKESGLSPVAMMAAYGNSQAITDQQKANLGIKAAESKERAEGTYLNALRMLSGEERAEWEWNKKEPYLDRTAAASALTNAGMQNQNAAVNQGLNAAANLAILNDQGYFDRNGTTNRSNEMVTPATPMYGQNKPYQVPNTYNPQANEVQAWKKQYRDVYGDMPDEEALFYMSLLQSPETI